MKTNKLIVGIGLFSLSLIAGLFVVKGNAFAATKTWTGAGSDKKFSTGANWSDSSAPVSGDSIVLPLDVLFAGCTNTSNNVELANDLNASTVTLAGLTTTGNKPQNCYAGITITGNVPINTSADLGSVYTTMNIASPIALSGNIKISNIFSSSSLTIGSHNVDLSPATFGGGISGSGQLTISSTGYGGAGGGCSETSFSSPFEGDSSGFSGAIVLNNIGNLMVSSRDTDVARHASSITVNGESTIDFYTDYGKNSDLSTPITINDQATLVASQVYCDKPTSNTTVTLSGTVTINGSITVDLYYADLKFTGTLTGAENLKLAEGQSGSIILPSGDKVQSQIKVVTIDEIKDCDGQYSVQTKNNKLLVNVDCTQSQYYKFDDPKYPLEVGGILAGVGKVGHIKINNGGVIAPGHSPGTLTTGNIEWEEGGIYEFEIGKDASDKIVANGTVKLGNGTLKVLMFEKYVPKAGAKYVIVENDGSDKVDGTFKDLPEGATFKTEDGGVYKISYVGGDGNDVELTIVSAPKVPNTGFNMLKNNPLLTFSITIVATGLIVVIARKRALHKA